MTPRKTLYDLHNLSEDQRIKLIADATANGQSVGFLVDVENGSHAKGDRYLEKLVPGVSVTFRGDGPVANVETIKVQVIQ